MRKKIKVTELCGECGCESTFKILEKAVQEHISKAGRCVSFLRLERQCKNKKCSNVMALCSLCNNDEVNCNICDTRKIERLIIPDFDSKRQIAIIWSIEDVQEVRPDLDDDQAMEVLERVKRHHDAEMGVSWETLRIVADLIYEENGEEN